MGPFNVSDIPWETRSLLYFHGTGRQRDKPLRTSTVWLWILIIEAWCQHMTNSLYVLLSRLQHFNVFWRLLDVSKQRNGFLSLENQIKCIWRKDETKLQSDFAFSAHLKEYAWKGWNVWSRPAHKRCRTVFFSPQPPHHFFRTSVELQTNAFLDSRDVKLQSASCPA